MLLGEIGFLHVFLRHEPKANIKFGFINLFGDLFAFRDKLILKGFHAEETAQGTQPIHRFLRLPQSRFEILVEQN